MSRHSLEDKRIYMKRAAEPTDVYWINIPIKNAQRFKNVIFSYIVMIISLVISLIINLALAMIKGFIEDQTNEGGQNSNFWITILLQAVSFGNGIAVSLINFALGRIVRYITLFENHDTYTDYNLSVAIKLMIGLFVNSGLIPFFVNYDEDNWFDQSGLVIDVFFVTISI